MRTVWSAPPSISNPLQAAKRRARAPKYCVGLLAFVLTVSNAFSQTAPTDRPQLDVRLIVHALGAVDGKARLNCEEAFRRSYASGHRYFEADFFITADKQLILLHAREDIGWPPGPITAQAFMAAKLLNRYTPLDVPRLAALMRENPDWHLISDTKQSNSSMLKLLCGGLAKEGISCAQRVIPQIYKPDEVALLDAHGFSRAILTLYRWGKHFDETVKLVAADRRIAAVTMPIAYFDTAVALRLKELGAAVYVHTVNNKKFARELIRRGATGVYTDGLTSAALDGD